MKKKMKVRTTGNPDVDRITGALQERVRAVLAMGAPLGTFAIVMADAGDTGSLAELLRSQVPAAGVGLMIAALPMSLARQLVEECAPEHLHVLDTTRDVPVLKFVGERVEVHSIPPVAASSARN